MAKKQAKEIPPKNDRVPLKEKIITAYKKHLLTKGENPPSIYIFAEELGISEAEFYSNFSSFDVLHKEIWNDFLKSTISTLHESAEYAEYSVREKMLSFYYTFVEIIKNNRSFILLSYAKIESRVLIPSFLKASRKTYFDYIESLIEEGLHTGEFKKRPYLSEKYSEALWLQFLFVFRFWVKDESQDFEQTDALIEKTVKLTFELLGESPLDSLIDLAKFLYQNK